MVQEIQVVFLRTIANHMDLRHPSETTVEIQSLVLQVFQSLPDTFEEMDYKLIEAATGCGIFVNHDEWLTCVTSLSLDTHAYLKSVAAVSFLLRWEWLDAGAWIHRLLSSWCQRVRHDYLLKSGAVKKNRHGDDNSEAMTVEQHAAVVQCLLNVFDAHVTANEATSETNTHSMSFKEIQTQAPRDLSLKFEAILQCLDCLILASGQDHASVTCTPTPDEYLFDFGFRYVICGLVDGWFGCMETKQSCDVPPTNNTHHHRSALSRLTYLLPAAFRLNPNIPLLDQVSLLFSYSVVLAVELSLLSRLSSD
jgi:hypothetical protein